MSLRDDVPQPATILLVEDGQVQTLLIKTALADLPQLDLLHVAKDGIEAVEFLRREVRSANGQLPDLILLDINMPKKDGFEVLAELKSDPVLRRVPVVVFTTSDSQEDIDRAYDKGASTFITKPVTLGDLGQVLDRIADYWVETARLPSSFPAAKEGKPRIWRSAS
jgi:chemotaxis family two-component system response regulator Rcp1